MVFDDVEGDEPARFGTADPIQWGPAGSKRKGRGGRFNEVGWLL
jgi:hypothetical protein